MLYLSSVESLYQHICKTGLHLSKSLKLVLVGGCSRAGKSTIVSRLSKYLIDDKVVNHIVNLDSWLIDIEKRKTNSTVLERYDCNAIINAIKKIMSGDIVYPPVYDVRSRRQTAEHGREPIHAKSGIILLEGVVALALKDLLDLSSFKIFVTVSDETRLKRLMDFYIKTKGVSENETKNIVYYREIEEVPFIKETAKCADAIVLISGT